MSNNQTQKRDITSVKGTASKPRKLSRNRAKKWLIGLAAIAVTAFVTANATSFGDTTASFIGNFFSSTGLPVQIDSVRTVLGPDDTHALSNTVVLSDSELSQLNALNQTDHSYPAWFKDKHAVDTDSTRVELIMGGNRNHVVRITGVQPVVSCQEPLTGTLFFSPSAGADTNTQLILNLDNPHELPSYISEDQNGTITSGKDFFAAHTVSLNKGEQFTFKIIAETTKHFCQFTLAMTVIDGDKTLTQTITNNGQPFQVTATVDKNPTTPGEFSAYHALYIGGVANAGHGTNSFGDDLWARADPQTYAQ